MSHDGLVRIYSRRGAFVSNISVQTILELYQMREALETYACRLAARARGEADSLEQLGKMIESRGRALLPSVSTSIDKCCASSSTHAKKRAKQLGPTSAAALLHVLDSVSQLSGAFRSLARARALPQFR